VEYIPATLVRSPSRTPAAARRPSPARTPPSASPGQQLQRRVGNAGITRLMRSGVVQARLTVNRPGDAFEREADRVADHVMRMPEPPAGGGIEAAHGGPAVQRMCPECEDDEIQRLPDVTLRRSPTIVSRMCPACARAHRHGRDEPSIQCEGADPEEGGEEEAESGETPPIQAKHEGADPPDVPADVATYLRSSRGAGTPLPPLTRGYFEPRFGRDFGGVRVHQDHRAARAARAIQARAFTTGPDVYFAAGEYRPGTRTGDHLLGHELTHVVQQGRSAPYAVQRACGPDEIAESTECASSEASPARPRFLFRVNCDEFAAGNEEDLRRDAEAIVDGETVEIHGFASIEGDPAFNARLSCARAVRARAVVQSVLTARGVSATIQLFNHGATPGDRTQQRSVVVTRVAPAPTPPPSTTSVCGPDATDWLVAQIAAAKRDPAVLAVKADLAGAARVARRRGFSAEQVAEGAVAQKVLAEEARAGSPTRTAEASAQLAAAAPGRRAFSVVLRLASVLDPSAMLVLAAVRRAALAWKNLVGTGRRFDFKNDPRTMSSPTSPNCPVDCANTITLCPSTGADCYIVDVPGNIFYAHLGRFVGWTELSLQLGSQFAQLEASRAWDPPEDTRMIAFAFALPDPLSRADLCAAINGNRSVFDIQSCNNCGEATSATVV
jgi:uncharacterized protein DUF4157/putative RNase toxin 44 of polymorphic toxin system